jgi:hypothetical protein
MLSRSLFVSMLLAAATCGAADVPGVEPMAKVETPPKQPSSEPSKEPHGDKTLSGMSILGNQEAPKSLVIVPWKSAEIGDELGLNNNLDDSRRPVDREVFLRELKYYEIRSGIE